MEELLKDSIGTIAILIYILYPMLKRWLDRRKQKKQRQQTTPSGPDPTPVPSPPEPVVPPPVSVPEPVSPPPSADRERRLMVEEQARRVRARATRLLDTAKKNPRLVRLVPALRNDVLSQVASIEDDLRSSPSIDDLADDARALGGLAELLGYLEKMAQQRLRSPAAAIGDADRMADACYAPFIEFARSHGLELSTSTPMVVSGDWQLAIVPRFADTGLAPIRVPRGFAQSIWLWPALAHEVAHDLYYSVGGLEHELHARLGLPHRVYAPQTEYEVNAQLVHDLYGAWLSEIFPDLIGTLTLGPAYVETMRRAFRDRQSPHRTAAIIEERGEIEEHPPARLRVYMATRVLHRLGRHEEADDLWNQWQADHDGIDLYFLPLSGRWVGIAEEPMHEAADAIIDVLLEESWPELADYRLLNIPGFAYSHAAHAEVESFKRQLKRGGKVTGDVRWIMAAAVLAVTEDPTLHDQVLDAAQRAILGVGGRPILDELPTEAKAGGSIGSMVLASLRSRAAVREAIILGEAISPYRRPGPR
ncbi:MAG: hypothetical protein AAF500_19495 [Myxococcota bacterium]